MTRRRPSDDDTVFTTYVDRWDATNTGLPRGYYYVRITAGAVQLARKATGPWQTLHFSPLATNGREAS